MEELIKRCVELIEQEKGIADALKILEKEFKNGKLKEIYQACRENYPNTDKVRTMFRYSNLKVINRITILQGEYGQYKVSKNVINYLTALIDKHGIDILRTKYDE